MSKHIILWTPKASLDSDDACTTILKYTLPEKYTPGPYEASTSGNDHATTKYVPSLKTLCINLLLEYPEQVYSLGVARVHYEVPQSPSDYDIIRSLIPGFSHSDPDIAFLQTVDPRLWALLIQILSPIPDAFRVYTLPLSDTHLPLLQQIPQTCDFSLVTVVELRRCAHLTDDTIHRLGELQNMCVLDIGQNMITSWGIRALAKTLQAPSMCTDRKGPWGLRIIDVRDCRIDSEVVQHLACFPLLSVVGAHSTTYFHMTGLKHLTAFTCRRSKWQFDLLCKSSGSLRLPTLQKRRIFRTKPSFAQTEGPVVIVYVS